MRIVAHCRGLRSEELAHLEKLKEQNSQLSVFREGSLSTITAFGTYDELIQLIVEITKFKDFEVHLQ